MTIRRYERGSILITVLLIGTILSTSLYRVLELIHTHITIEHHRQSHARLQLSSDSILRCYLNEPDTIPTWQGSHSPQLDTNNPTHYKQIIRPDNTVFYLTKTTSTLYIWAETTTGETRTDYRALRSPASRKTTSKCSLETG